MLVILSLVLALQQISPTTPPGGAGALGDTVGYWQQRVAYRMVARLDERAAVVHGSGVLTYVNQSPDTLHEMYFHQYLNAFRPGSRWSAADEREGRERFQHLREPNTGYERFTSTPTFDGTPVAPEYPLSPDSTVVRFVLPGALAPGDSVRVHFDWDARLSATIYRRQGRRGRHYDFAEWYPKVAVYDRSGWEENPFVPAGEMYGEFGTYDVTLVLPSDQVVGATGVPVAGDPGWERVRTWGTVDLASHAYGDFAIDSTVTVPPGYRAVRFRAEGVHHFAWTVAPDYRYEGTLYRGTIPVHVLYQPGDEARWGHGQAVGMIVRAMQWLESIYGPYAYPQVTGTHRLEGGATEFPMMVMYGGLSEGLVLHETGHIYTYGLLANNEWRSGWMDEGLTEYQAAWAQRLTLPERARGEAPVSGAAPTGYRARALGLSVLDRGPVEQFRLDLSGRAEPIGTPAYAFSEFGIYNQMVYGRASMMYGALRDVIGDSAFVRFLHDYYARWKFKHVDERAMQGSAERVSGRHLGWFFHQWVHETGLVDYVLRDVQVRRDGAVWVTRARVQRVGAYRHPMPVGVRTGAGWVTARIDPARDEQWVELRTAGPPAAVRVDPQHLTPEWDRRDDSRADGAERGRSRSRVVPDWPFLLQRLRSRELIAVTPLAWYTDPGGVTPALRVRTNYQGWLDRWELGIAMAARAPGTGRSGRLQGWVSVENPDLPFTTRPLIGVRAGAWVLDGVAKLELAKTWDVSPFYYANGGHRTWTLALAFTDPYDTAWVDPRRWADVRVADASLEYRWEGRDPSGLAARASIVGGVVDARATGARRMAGFERAEVEATKVMHAGGGSRTEEMFRLFAGVSDRAPVQRSIGLSALDATATFGNPLSRGRGAPLARSDVHFLALGGAGARGYSPLLRVRNVAAGNAQLAVALDAPRRGSIVPRVSVDAFADGAWGTLAEPGASAAVFADAGTGVSFSGSIFDQSYTARLDVPLWVRSVSVAVARVGSGGGRGGAQRLWWAVSLNDLW